jgi:hypothetical protein
MVTDVVTRRTHIPIVTDGLTDLSCKWGYRYMVSDGVTDLCYFRRGTKILLHT